MAKKPNKKPPLLAQEAVKVQQTFIPYITTHARNNTICQLYRLIKHDPQARRFLAALLEELDEKEATA